MLGLTILLFTISCKKDDLPAATQEGKNIMAAKIDGTVWIKTACFGCIGAGSGISTSYENSILNIGAEQFKSKIDDTVISLSLNGDTSKEYIANGAVNSIKFKDYGNSKSYKTTIKSTGVILITKIDKLNKIISGTFSGIIENENDPNDVKNITDGRFDVTYN